MQVFMCANNYRLLSFLKYENRTIPSNRHNSLTKFAMLCFKFKFIDKFLLKKAYILL